MNRVWYLLGYCLSLIFTVLCLSVFITVIGNFFNLPSYLILFCCFVVGFILGWNWKSIFNHLIGIRED